MSSYRSSLLKGPGAEFSETMGRQDSVSEFSFSELPKTARSITISTV